MRDMMFRRMKSKKGFLRIVEAFIAILIIAGAMSYVYVQKIDKPNEAESIKQLEKIILTQIANNEDLRLAVLKGDSGLETSEAVNHRITINNTISPSVPSEYNFATKICNLDQVCELGTYNANKEVFVNEITVSSTLEYYGPKKLRLFMWRRD